MKIRVDARIILERPLTGQQGAIAVVVVFKGPHGPLALLPLIRVTESGACIVDDVMATCTVFSSVLLATMRGFG